MDAAPMTAFETEPISPATGAVVCLRQRMGLLRRMMTTPRGRASEMEAPMAPLAAADDPENPRRGWLRRLMSRKCVHRRRWKSLGGASRLSGLSQSLRWKRLSTGFSVSLKSGWASALLDTVAFRVMYVLEAIVLVLGLSCFFCCCGCQI